MEDLLAVVVPLLVVAFFGLVVGLLAKRKSRNPWGWGVLGAMAPVLGLLVLMFMPYLCPRCRRAITNTEARAGTCPSCHAAA